jgi:mono/diheme cytochrome c family protein
MKRLIAGIAIIGGMGALMILAGAARQADLAAAQSGSDGAAVYADNCASCHQADGAGIVGAFPPLANNPNAADGAYVEKVILEGLSGPIDVLGETYNSSMPSFSLAGSDLSDLVSYVQSLAGGAGPSDTTGAPGTTAAPPPSSGDVERGEKLFAGSVGFTNRGPACHACHAAGPLGLRGGSGLGPDLTDVASRLGGEAGLSGWLANPASATMQPLFADKELTSSEASDVAAYLASIQSESPAGGFDRLLLGGLLGLAVLLLFMGVVIRKPRETYTDRLRSQS